MTIGIGFICLDGLVIGADTQYTRGAFKGHGPKLFPLFKPVERQNLTVIIAGAGKVAFMRRAVQKIENALGALSDPSLEDVQRVVEDELLDFFETYIYPKPDYKSDQAWFELILGVWTRTDGFGLLKTEDVTVNPVVTGHCTIGMGFSVADYALGLTLNPIVTIENATFVAALAIKAAKDYVDYCGGKTHIWTIKETPLHRLQRVPPIDISEAEQYSVDLFETLQYVISCLDPESLFDEESVGAVTDMIKDGVMAFRKKQIERREQKRQLQEKAEEAAERIRAKRRLTPPAP